MDWSSPNIVKCNFDIRIFYVNQTFVIQKQVKINAGKMERRFGVVIFDAIFKFKNDSNKLSGIVAGD